ncbi:putative metallo-dependent phosphatase [Alcanivorax hongdengensis A-11-3]|uniref:Putative metallo-dependent phosphatase n=1 Tax=Alcanivorax hongdengensis A-11-3 TaxID=1177179 RepID=L0WIY0_9GAMM|nr:metallophosphoesterase [Alcanivorax hongdengensis]EKF76142.1 putative metallo-dependent phosphatase [Alcanivorax hongdengensis A-11-3]
MGRRLRTLVLLLLIPLSALVLTWWWHVPHGPWLIHNQPLAGQKICVIGDGGWGNDASQAIGRALVTLQCDQVRYLGDLVYPSGIQSVDDPLLKARFLDPLKPALDAGIPVYLVLGNHDWKGNARAWLTLARQNPLIHFPHYYYFEQWPDACAFSLETTWLEKWYYLRRQGNWLDSALNNARQHHCRFSLGFAHHPLVSSGSHGEAGPNLQLSLNDRLFGRLDLYLSGHEHILSDEGSYQGTRQLISGSASINNDLGLPSQEQRFTRATHGVLTLVLHDDNGTMTADYRFYSVLGNPREPLITLLWQGDKVGQGIRPAP